MPDYSQLSALLPDVCLHIVPQTLSTNADARALLLADAPHGALAVACRQSGGRGRMGRAFCSEDGGLYMSIALRGSYPAGQLTTLCAVAVCRAVEQLTGLQLDIKWVNDALFHGKKACGILCEGVWSGNTPIGMIAGIGVNLSQPAFPEALDGIACSLYPHGDAPCTHAQLCAAIYQQVMAALPAMPAHMAQYRARCVTLHHRVTWQMEGVTHTGLAVDVDQDGGLILHTGGGLMTLRAGEVSVQPD